MKDAFKGAFYLTSNVCTTDCDWWRLRAGDIEAMLSRSAGPSARWSDRLIEWSGTSWDGTSALQVGDDWVAGEDISLLLSQLNFKIAQLGLDGVRAPTVRDVRACAGGPDERERLTVDIDFEDFILPIAIDASAFGGGTSSLSPSVDGVIRHVLAATRTRRSVSRREAVLRRALEETSARIGGGCAPLWLRMDPIPSDRHPRLHSTSCYKMVTTLLNDSLSASPSLPEAVWTVGDIRDHWRLHDRVQRRRKTMASELVDTGSSGAMTEVSLSLIRAARLDPFATLQTAHAARIQKESGEVKFQRWGCLNILSWIDGVLRTSIQFEQGSYEDGELMLHGDYPASLALASMGRPLSTIVDHPAFRASGVVVTNANITEEAFYLSHDNRVMPVAEIAVA